LKREVSGCRDAPGGPPAALRPRYVGGVQHRADPPRDPVTEVFDAVVHARRAAPGGEGGWTVGVRSRTGQLMARFTLDSHAQVLAFAARARPLGYRIASNEGAGPRDFDFCLDRRAANEALHHPLRRHGD
jgi:hypothetical protein